MSGHSHVLLAVSGGSDSLALLYLANDWANRHGRLKISVATIDHGLRAASKGEAQIVGQNCSELAVRHIIKPWTGTKPASGVSQKSRLARYGLLAGIAADIGATAIVLGHTIDDQRETVLMRARRLGFTGFDGEPAPDTNRGLAGMPRLANHCGPPDYQPLGLFRPLLGTTRAKLRRYLTIRKINWTDDPANDDLHYERARVRQQLAKNPANFPSASKVSLFAGKVAARRATIADQCAEIIAGGGWHYDFGVFTIERAVFEMLDHLHKALMLRTLVAVAGGRNYLASPAAADKLCIALGAGGPLRRTLGSAIVEQDRSHIRLWRENRNLPVIELATTIAANSPQWVAWDGRIVFRFERDQLAQKLVLAPFGLAGLQYVEKTRGKPIGGHLRLAMRSQPAVFRRGEPVFVPGICWCASGFNAPDWRYWSPALEMFRADCDKTLFEAVKKLRDINIHKAY